MELTVKDVPEMYSEMMIVMRMRGLFEESRNGPVLSLPEPITVTVLAPKIRANVDPIRNANPFFHLMEFVWMMSGSCELAWIQQFNQGFKQYAEDNGRIHGAYGYRWRNHFGVNQIAAAVNMLREDATNRRVVLGMWDPGWDLDVIKKDLPCNTHIYLRIIDWELEMTVCNRSNDVIWGMTGANAVHMTLLQELMANAIGCDVGVYRVFTNNAHVYTDLPNVESMLDTRNAIHVKYSPWKHVPVLGEGETLAMFLKDCERFVSGGWPYETRWIQEVAVPVRERYLDRELEYPIADSEWEQACNLWLQRKCQ